MVPTPLACVYIIRNLNTGCVYVGSTVRGGLRRWAVHKNDARAGRHHSRHFQRAWDKHGEHAFVFGVVEFVAERAAVTGREQWHLDESVRTLGRAKVYNVCPRAGSCLGRTFTAAQRRRLSESRKGRRPTAEQNAKHADTWVERYGKSYELRGPDGTLYKGVRNLRRFAREQGLVPESLGMLTRGRCRSYRGWTVPGNEPPLLSFVDPAGNEHKAIRSLKQFCLEHGLPYKKMSDLNTGHAASYRGWGKGQTVGKPHKTWGARPRRKSGRGSDRPMAKLDELSVAACRAEYAAGGVTIESLAAGRSVSRGTMRKAIAGVTWKHVA